MSYSSGQGASVMSAMREKVNSRDLEGWVEVLQSQRSVWQIFLPREKTQGLTTHLMSRAESHILARL